MLLNCIYNAFNVSENVMLQESMNMLDSTTFNDNNDIDNSTHKE